MKKIFPLITFIISFSVLIAGIWMLYFHTFHVAPKVGLMIVLIFTGIAWQSLVELFKK